MNLKPQMPIMRSHAERRAKTRRLVNLSATVVYDDGLARIPGTIRDVSSVGARLELVSLTNLPKTFYMLLPEHRVQPCSVVWQTDRSLGLAFSLPADL